MSATAYRWPGACQGCGHERQLEQRYSHAARCLCDECAARPHKPPSAISLDSKPVTSLPTGAGRARGATSQQEQDARAGGSQPVRERPVPVPVPAPVPAPAGSKEPTELELLISEHRAGRLQPADVKLGELPAAAGTAQRAVAEHIRWLMGLRLAFGDTRPLPYATSMAVKAGLVADQGTASAVIRALVRFGVIEHVGQLPPLRPGLDGTKLYAPPAAGVSRPAS